MSGEKLLSAAQCKAAKSKEALYYLNDGGGLRLRIRPNVARGYRLIGEPKAGIPCISHDYEKVFATQTDLAKKLNYDKSDLGRLLRDHTPDEVLQKLGRVLK